MRRPIRILTSAAVVPLVVLALAACTFPSPPPIVISSSPATPTPTAAPRIAVTAAAALAAREVGGGTVTSVSSESDGSLWEVVVVAEDGTEQELHLGRTGTVVAGPSSEPTDAEGESANRSRVAALDVTLADAATRMLAAVQRGTITAIELDEDDDRVVWQGDVTDTDGVRHDVRIDAVNGSVVLDQADGAATPAPTSGS